MCKTNKWDMHNQETNLGNETDILLWDFQKPTNHLILARRSDLVTVKQKKKTGRKSGLCRPG